MESLEEDDVVTRMPSYLEDDSPATQGAIYILQPTEQLFSIPGGDITAELIDGIPKFARSKVVSNEIMRKSLRQNTEDAEERMRKIEESLRSKKVKDARNNMVKKSTSAATAPRAPASKNNNNGSSKPRFRHKYMEPKSAAVGGPTISSSARQYLLSQNMGNGRKASSFAEKGVETKVHTIREDVSGGATTLDQLRVPHHLPKDPRPSSHHHRLEQSTADLVHKSPQEIEDARVEAMLHWRGTHLLRGALAAAYFLGVSRRFQRLVLVHRYESDPAAMLQIVRLQRWSRHVRLKWVFKHLLKKRRVVYKAVGWWMIGARLRYRKLCSTRIRTFFKACFNEGGFRMAMKIFLFRVIKVQRCIRSFLACQRARIVVLCMKMNAVARHIVPNDRHPVQTAGCVRYVTGFEPHRVRCIINKYRAPFMAQRAEYRRALKVGDMTPSFQELDLDKIGAFLKQPQQQAGGGGPGGLLDTDLATPPPQYAGDVIRQPIMLLYTRMFLVQEFAGVAREALGAYRARERQLAIEEAEYREKKAMEEAMARGEGQAHQLRVMQEKMKHMVDPRERYEEGVEELQAYMKRKKKAAQDTARSAEQALRKRKEVQKNSVAMK